MSNSLFSTLNISQSAMQSQLKSLDVTSNNLANITTVGFKGARGNFQELLSKTTLEGTKMSSSQILTDQGALITTQNPLDVAIQGDGFFQVKLADGRTAYTRDGQLHLDANNTLVTSGGQKLIWSGAIPVGTEEIAITNNGTVNTRIGTVWSVAGTIQTARFTNPTALQGYGQNMWLASTNSGAAQTGIPGAVNFGTLQSNTTEGSNVNIANEMTNMTILQRAFQMSTKAFQTTDTMISQAIHMRKG
jgi:flagellar basal-body rod protein FlgG